jgi:hypothetical protein
VVLAEPMSEKAHLDAVMALLSRPSANPFTLQQLKDAPASPDVVQRGPRSSSGSGPVPVGLVLRRHDAVADPDPLGGREVRQRPGDAAKADLALHEAKVTVDGEVFFIERAVTDDPIGEDDGWWSGVSEFAY